MARPRKQTVDYFPHFCNSGKTIYILENNYGNDGYAFWFKLLELLATTEGHFYDCNNPAMWQFLLAKTRVNEDTANKILTTLSSVDAIDRELWGKKVVWVENLVKNIADVYRRRQVNLPQKPNYSQQEHKLIRVSADNNPNKPENSGISDNENPQSKVKYNKVKYSRKQTLEKSTALISDLIRQVWAGLNKRRDYESPNRVKESAAIKWMFRQGYTPDQILATYDKMKRDKFWADKHLDMQSVKKQIGEMVKGRKPADPTAKYFGGKYGHMVHR